jgi:SulP family sulfate permease
MIVYHLHRLYGIVSENWLRAMANLRFHDWLPADRIFQEEDEKFSATLKAVRWIYAQLEHNSCPHCGQNELVGADRRALYYLV